jgi:DNA-binding HxlR family transcriptional regulator
MAIDDTCPVCRTAEVVCGKWTLLLVRDLAEGRSRFCELERSLAGISPRTLSLRLRALEDEGIVERHTFPEVPPRVEYALTDKGLALLPIIEDMRSYGECWLGIGCEGAVKAALTDAATAKLRSQTLAEYLAEWETRHGSLTTEDLAQAAVEMGLPSQLAA